MFTSNDDNLAFLIHIQYKVAYTPYTQNLKEIYKNMTDKCVYIFCCSHSMLKVDRFETMWRPSLCLYNIIFIHL